MLLVALVAMTGTTGCRTGQLGAMVNGTLPLGGSGGPLSEGRIVKGLKEALRVGTSNAVQQVSQKGGYLENARIRIPLPEPVQRAERIARTVGLGETVDAFEVSMNRAAEKAAPQAADVFLDALRQMTFSDARGILQGEENAATAYFKEKTQDRLQERFEPIVHESMARVGVTETYQRIQQRMEALPYGDLQRFDLDRYVTGQALEGLFFVLEQEERKIRRDPAARVSAILREVFGRK
jgi:hypothetical protein